MSKIKLIHGVSVDDTQALRKEYRLDGETIELTLSAEDYKEFFKQAVRLLPEPVFFFLEIPREDDDEGYDTYYLDNCTIPVAEAILDRYGGDTLLGRGYPLRLRLAFGRQRDLYAGISAPERIFEVHRRLLRDSAGTGIP